MSATAAESSSSSSSSSSSCSSSFSSSSSSAAEVGSTTTKQVGHKKRKASKPEKTFEQLMEETVRRFGVWGKLFRPTRPLSYDDIYMQDTGEDSDGPTAYFQDVTTVTDIGSVRKYTHLKMAKANLATFRVRLWEEDDTKPVDRDDADDSDDDDLCLLRPPDESRIFALGTDSPDVLTDCQL